MNLNNQNILFFVRTMHLGGTENVVLQLCEIFKPYVNSITVCSAGGVNESILQEMGIKHYQIPDIENKSVDTLLSVSRRLKQIVKEEKITVIHTHHRMAAFYVRFLGLNKKCCFINTSHNTFSNKHFLTRYAYRKCHLIACGKMVKKNLQDEFGLSNVTVIHNAIKPFDGVVQVENQFKNAKDEGKFLIGNVGRLSEQKGMEYYLKAIPEIIKKHPEAIFYIIGEGEDEEKLKELGKGLPVSFLGYRSDIQNLMSQLDLLVLSSLWEGLPLTPIEAFSVGKSIVATGVDGTVEIVNDGVNGLIAEKKDEMDLAKKICWMIEHPTEKKKMEENAKETFVQDYSFKVLAQAYIKYYRSL